MPEDNPHNPEQQPQTNEQKFYELGNTIARWRHRTENLFLRSEGMDPNALQDPAANHRREDVKMQLLDYESDYTLNALEGLATHLDDLGWNIGTGDITGFKVLNMSVYLTQKYQDANGVTQQRLWRYYFYKNAQEFRLHVTDEFDDDEFEKPTRPESQVEADLGINDVPLSPEQVKELLFALDTAKDAIKEYYALAGNGVIED